MTGQYELKVETAGERLDRFVASGCPGLSRTHAQELIATGLVTVNGKPAKSSLKLSPGDIVRVTVPPSRPRTSSRKTCR